MNIGKNKTNAPGINYIRTQSGSVIAIPASSGKPGEKQIPEKKAGPGNKKR